MLPALVQFIECELNAVYTDSTEYQIWHFENNSDTVRRLNTCINVSNPKDIFLTYTNFDLLKNYPIPGGSDSPVIQKKDFKVESEIFHLQDHPEFVRTFDPMPLLQTESNPSLKNTVSFATGGGVGTVDVTTYAWKTSDSATSSGQSCYIGGQPFDQVQTTLRGIRTLPTGRVARVWVADQDWDALDPNVNGKLHPVKVGAVLDAFHKDGTVLNIYEKVRKITGSEEWGGHNFSTLLNSGFSFIDLVYYDINCDNIIGGTVGFFFSGNNFLNASVAHSNESLVLFLDSKYYTARDGTTWEPTDRFPSLSFNTLAHEFQHMIHFYQKSVRNRQNSAVWFNEMMSMAVEDVISTYTLGTNNSLIFSGSQGLGRFVTSSDCSLNQWNLSSNDCDLLADYAHVYSYSAFLNRNFGGGDLITKILQNTDIDQRGIDRALESNASSFRDSLRRLGASMILNPVKGSYPPGYGFPEFRKADYFGSGMDIHLPAGNPFSFTFPPKIYDSWPANILAGSSVTLNWKKKFSGSAQEDLYLPPRTSVTLTIGVNPKN